MRRRARGGRPEDLNRALQVPDRPGVAVAVRTATRQGRRTGTAATLSPRRPAAEGAAQQCRQRACQMYRRTKSVSVSPASPEGLRVPCSQERSVRSGTSRLLATDSWVHPWRARRTRRASISESSESKVSVGWTSVIGCWSSTCQNQCHQPDGGTANPDRR